jgi:hypothetical protein
MVPTRFETIEEMQAVLDEYFEGYNTRRLHLGRGMNGRTPIQAFTEGMPKPATRKRPATQKLPSSKSHEAHVKCVYCRGNIVVAHEFGFPKGIPKRRDQIGLLKIRSGDASGSCFQ